MSGCATAIKIDSETLSVQNRELFDAWALGDHAVFEVRKYMHRRCGEYAQRLLLKAVAAFFKARGCAKTTTVYPLIAIFNLRPAVILILVKLPETAVAHAGSIQADGLVSTGITVHGFAV